MTDIIQEKLSEIEAQHGISILFACELGSRGWGFPSPNSDYDVRFIYSQPVNRYLSVQKRTDQFTFPITDELDINGWDISKTIQLIIRSNATPSEWLQSPVIYRDSGSCRMELWNLCKRYFCARSHTHHYLGVAKNALETLQDENIRIKKFFYLLRSLLSAYWCVEKKEIAPMNITPLLGVLPEALRQEVQELILLKANREEGFLIRISTPMQQWIKETFDHCREVSAEIEKCSYDPESGDELFRKLIHTYDHTGN
ncbi:MAG: nucleotidyltransferase domain-containing protein [Tannerellaceae bacterium]|nr:nucleotidyltransferase domain-containing protein [Tannerellaceae bacterium]